MTEDQEYVVLKDLPKLFPIFTKSALQYMIHTNKKNFNSCVRRVGRKIVIHIPSFKEWLESCKEKQE